jgi:hypothetical protein
MVYLRRKISIKMDKLCQTKPISEMPKMIATSVTATTNNNEQPTSNHQKQTQSNPILPAIAGKIALSAVEGAYDDLIEGGQKKIFKPGRPETILANTIMAAHITAIAIATVTAQMMIIPAFRAGSSTSRSSFRSSRHRPMTTQHQDTPTAQRTIHTSDVSIMKAH